MGDLWRPTLYRTLFSLLRRGGARIVPIAELSTFADGETLDLPGRPVVVHAPGHTPGSSALHLPALRVLFTGDSLATWNPLTGRVGPQVMPSAFNTHTSQAVESLGALEAIGEADLLLPGHGEPWWDGLTAATRHARELGPS
jgi:glyoxylase-like metal-dependent hydrolase (beta-lactamase superfamily II)